MKELDVVKEIVLSSGKIMLEGWNDNELLIEHKGPADIVTNYDKKIEEKIKNELSINFPTYGLIGEEGTLKNTNSEYRWHIDPIDGTINFSKKYPRAAISVALERCNEIVLGVVYNPIMDELFIAEKGSGATLNNKKIQVSDTRTLSNAVLSSGFPIFLWQSDDDNLKEWSAMYKKALTIRCDGSAALDLCYVACGRFDGYWEHGLDSWDIAAGSLVASEAGAVVTDFKLDNEYLSKGEIVAGNKYIIQEIVKVLNNI